MPLDEILQYEIMCEELSRRSLLIGCTEPVALGNRLFTINQEKYEMTATAQLGSVRADVISSYWEYLNKSFDLEYEVAGNSLQIPLDEIVRDWEELSTCLGHLDPRARGAIVRVFNFELRNLLMRCKMEAEHMAPLKHAVRQKKLRNS